MTPIVADALVLFGATGDLAKRKLFPALYQLERRGRLNLPVIGVGRSAWDHGDLRDYARAAVEAANKSVDQDALNRLTARLHMVSGEYADESTFAALAAELKDSNNPAFYLAIPPELFPVIVQGLESSKLNTGDRVSGDGAASRCRRRSSPRREGQGLDGDEGPRPQPARAGPVHRLSRRERRETRLDGRDVRGNAFGHRLVAMVGCAVLRTGRQGVGDNLARSRGRAQRATEHVVHRRRFVPAHAQRDPLPYGTAQRRRHPHRARQRAGRRH